jgi:hypothetical protein
MEAFRTRGLVLCCVIWMNLAEPAFHPRIEGLIVERNVAITPPGGAHLDWYEMKIDPEDENNMIVCGARRSPQDNAYFGVVYFSGDAGRSWRTALEDRGSSWVSEQSCTFGERHRAYFISEASLVVDGVPHHHLGTTRIFLSSDAGASWTQSAKTDWADFSSSAVGKPLGSRDQKLYVFYNSYRSTSEQSVRKGGSTLDYFTVSEDGREISSRESVPGMGQQNYEAVFPSSSVALKDGTPVVLYTAARPPVSGEVKSLEIGVARFGADGPSIPVVVATPSVRYEAPVCPATLSNSLAYDWDRELLYVAYNDARPSRCATMFSQSRDGGRTWSAPHELRLPENSRQSVYFPVLAVNHDGVLGLLWRTKPRGSPGCWKFSISRDAQNLEDTVALSSCTGPVSLKDQSSDDLSTVIQHTEAGQPVAVHLLTLKNSLLRVGFAASLDNAFHPLWPASTCGAGEVRTARVRLPGQFHQLPMPSVNTQPPDQITDKIAILFGGEQRIDQATHSVMLDLLLRNDSSVSISGPIYLEVEEINSDFGELELKLPTVASSWGPRFLDLSYTLRHGRLAPGQTTMPYRLAFHMNAEKFSQPRKKQILDLKLRVFSGRAP